MNSGLCRIAFLLLLLSLARFCLLLAVVRAALCFGHLWLEASIFPVPRDPLAPPAGSRWLIPMRGPRLPVAGAIRKLALAAVGMNRNFLSTH